MIYRPENITGNKGEKNGGEEVSTIIHKLQQVVNSRWKSL